MQTTEKLMNEIKFSKDSGYTSSEGFSPVHSSSEGDKTSRKRVHKIEDHGMVENASSFNKIEWLFLKENDPSNCSKEMIWLEFEIKKWLVIDDAKCNMTKNEAYSFCSSN